MQHTMPIHDQPAPSSSEAQLMFASAEMEKYRTHHLLHLLLSIVTIGLWFVIWLAVSIRNTHRRNRIRRDYGLPAETHFGYLILFFLVLFAVGGYLLYSPIYIGTQTEAGNASADAAAQKTKPGAHWTYAEADDPLGRGAMITASTSALNEIAFGSTDAGKQRAVLTLRKNADNSHAVYLEIQQGRFQCDNRACGITARFDSGLVQFFEASPMENANVPGIYISNADIFIQLTEAANTLVVTADFFDQPSQTFQFDISGLTWE